MPNHKSPAANGNSVPTYLPLSQAARKYNISENVLTRMIQDGRIDAAQLPSGELLVSDDGLSQTKTKEQIIEENFAHLRGQAITVTEAVDRYGKGFHRNTILEWVRRGYITILKPGYRMALDEADVAYCALVYNNRREQQNTVFGARIFDDKGNPYHLKHPELAEKRRQKD